MRIESTARSGQRHAAAASTGTAAHTAAPGTVDPRVVLAFRPDHPDAERARDIRAELLARWPDAEGHRHRTVALVALDEGGRMAEIAANVAVAFAQLDRRTLLIDADLRQPAQHALFQIGNDRGLADVLEGRADVAAAVLPTAVPGLSVMPTGPADEGARDAVERRPLLERLDERVLRADVLVVAMGGYGVQALATALTHFDAVVPVVRRGRTRMRQLKALVEALDARGISTSGVVVSP